jgi:hypothetical protein
MIDDYLDIKGGCDIMDDMAFVFYDVITKKTIGAFPPGVAFETALVDYDKGTMTLQRKGREYRFRVTLTFTPGD